MQKYIDGISKTGFGLEYITAKLLMDSGWTVISNKYYIDDVQKSAREVDIIAYKVAIVDEIQVYTVLIISCKKSEDKSWVLISKDKDVKNPNLDWSPVKLWSNDPIAKLIIEKFNWKESYINGFANKEMLIPSSHIFAFQELNNVSGKPQNQKSIYDSIISTMKSQDYEIISLNKRKKEKAIYNFNLISIVDAPLYKVSYPLEEDSFTDIDSDIYVGNYIINQKETESIVHFIRSSSFQDKLKNYNDIHSYNKKFLLEIENIYYKDCLKDSDKVNIKIDKLNRILKWDLYELMDKETNYRDLNVSINWSTFENSAKISIGDFIQDEHIDKINSDKPIRQKAATALKELYKYTGDFSFDGGIPF